MDDEHSAAATTAGAPGSSLPGWFRRAVWFVIVSIFAAIGLWYVAARLTDLMVTVAICFFIAFAMEPTVNRLNRSRGIPRGRATLLLFLAAILVSVFAAFAFGKLFVDQVVALFSALPHLYESVRDRLMDQYGVTLPEGGDVVAKAVSTEGAALAGGVLGLVGTFLGFLFGSLTVLLVTYYLVADGPRFRRSVLTFFAPKAQREMLAIWEIAIDKTSSFIVSRFVLATICAAFTAVFLLIVQVPNWLALGVFTGVVAQFVPTVGTYIAGAVPVLYAFATRGTAVGIAVLVFILVYQQIENLTIEPQIGARAMHMNPAVSFLAVLAGAAVLGPVGAFLALPFAATVQAFVGTYARRQELIESDLLAEEVLPRRTDPTEPGARARAVTRLRRHGPGPARRQERPRPVSRWRRRGATDRDQDGRSSAGD
jgi:predicted PurR-regulated permease PerM